MIDLPHAIYDDVIVAMAEAKLGHKKEARAAVDRILVKNPDFGAVVAADLGKRNFHPDLVKMMIGALREAGLPISEINSRY